MLFYCFNIDPTSLTEANSTQEQSSDSVSITLPPDLFESFNSTDPDIAVVFEMYNSSLLFPLANETRESYAVGSTVVGATVVDQSISNLTTNVTIVLKLVETVNNYTIL